MVESTVPFLRLEFATTSLALPFLALLALVSCPIALYTGTSSTERDNEGAPSWPS